MLRKDKLIKWLSILIPKEQIEYCLKNVKLEPVSNDNLLEAILIELLAEKQSPLPADKKMSIILICYAHAESVWHKFK